MAEMVGFDGRACWAVDMTGMPRALELLDRDYHLLQIGLCTGVWLAHVEITDLALEPEGRNQSTVVLAVKKGRFKGKLLVNRQTWLPVAFERTGVTGAERWTFADYRDDLGWKLPGKIIVNRAGSSDDSYEAQSINLVPSTHASSQVFEPMTKRPKDAHFNKAVPSRLEVKRAPTGHLLVHPRVDGVDIGWFIFDTGAGSSAVLDPSAVARLKLERLGLEVDHQHDGQHQNHDHAGRVARDGPDDAREAFPGGDGLGFRQKGHGRRGRGDYRLRPPESLRRRAGSRGRFDLDPRSQNISPRLGAWQKLTLHQALPTVEGTFEGDRRGRFRIDVGAAGPAGTVVFHAPAVEEMQLLKDRTVTNAQAGPNRIALGKIAWFELAGHRFLDPTVLFALDRHGPLGDEYVEGNLGVEMLKPFCIVLDYPHEQMAFLRRDAERR